MPDSSTSPNTAARVAGRGLRPTRRRLLVAAAAVVAIGVAAACAALSRTGLIGFVVVGQALLLAGLGLIQLRTVRRLGSRVARLEGAQRKARDEQRRRGSDPDGPERRWQRSVQQSLGTTETGLRDLTGQIADRRVQLDTIDLGQQELIRTVNAGLHPGDLRAHGDRQSRQFGALLDLAVLAPAPGRPDDLPPVTQPAALAVLLAELIRRRPRLTVLTDLTGDVRWFARALAAYGSSGGSSGAPPRLVALVEDTEAADRVHRALASDGVEALVELRTGPRVDVDVDGVVHRWFDRSLWQDLGGIDFLVVGARLADESADESANRSADRFPAVAILADRLAPAAAVAADRIRHDADRRMLDRWQVRLPEFKPAAYPELEVTILSRSPANRTAD